MNPSPRKLGTSTLLAALCLTSCSIGLEYSNIVGFDSQGNPILDTSPETDVDADADADGDGDADADADTDADGDITITGVDPYYGTTLGGQTVTITGGPFDSSAQVVFGSNTASIENYGTSQLVVTSPSASGEGSVDVQVTTDADSGRADDAFYYFEDATGQAGMVGNIVWYEYVGNFWKDPTPFGEAWVSIMVPDDFHLWDWYAPSTDSCVDDTWTSSDKIYVYELDVNSVTIRPSSGSSTNLSWDSFALQYYNDDLSGNQFQTNANYDIDTITSSKMVPIEVTRLAQTPSTFSFTQPSMTGTAPERVSRSSFNIRWSGSGGDRMLIMAFMYNAAGNAVEQSIYCVANDDGSFQIPSSAWSGYSSGRYVMLALQRMKEGGGTIEYNNSESRVVGSYTIIGLVQTQ